jgi:solute:Na+ symporter, SSS family
MKKFYDYDPSETFKIVTGVGITTVAWLTVTFLTKPADDKTLRSFYQRIRPGGPGWKKVVDKARSEGIELQKAEDLKWDVPTGILCMVFGVTAIYSTLFAIGEWLYGNLNLTLVFGSIAIVSLLLLTKFWQQLRMD